MSVFSSWIFSLPVHFVLELLEMFGKFPDFGNWEVSFTFNSGVFSVVLDRVIVGVSVIPCISGEKFDKLSISKSISSEFT